MKGGEGDRDGKGSEGKGNVRMGKVGRGQKWSRRNKKGWKGQ